jgi:hypothetical protein
VYQFIFFQWLFAYHRSDSSGSLLVTYLVPVAHYLSFLLFQWLIVYQFIFFQWLITGYYETEKPRSIYAGLLHFYFGSTQTVACTELHGVPRFITVRHFRALFLSTVSLPLTGLVDHHVSD